jgi:hypothetical protein
MCGFWIASSLTRLAMTDQRAVIASEAKQSKRQCGFWIASSLARLAMTLGRLGSSQ